MRTARARGMATAVLLLILAAAGHTQYHTTGYVTCGMSLHLVQPSGQVATLHDNPGYSYGLTMAGDNRAIWFADTATHGVARFDPQTLSVTTVIVSSVALYCPCDLTLNQDGDLLVTSMTQVGTITRFGLMRISSHGITTLCMAPATGAAGWFGGSEIDIDTGDCVIQGKVGVEPLLSIAADGKIRTLATGFDSRYSIAQDIRTGDWYSSRYLDMYRLRKGSSTPVAFGSIGSYRNYYAMDADRASAVRPRIVSQYADHFFFTDLSTKVVTSLRLPVNAWTKYELDFYRGRNLASTRVGPRQWALNLSFPLGAAKPYALALSVSGVRPGIQLSDGRMICLTPDPVTFLTLTNSIPAVFRPGPGYLDSNGEATAALNVSGLSATNGLRVFAAALTLDPRAPSGIGTIADPIGITLP